MNRLLIVVAGLALGLAAATGDTVAQESTDPPPSDSTIADGGYVVANDEENPNVSGEGPVQVHGNIETGGAGGEVLGDAAALVENLGIVPDHDSLVNNVPPPTTDSGGDGLTAPPPAPPADGVTESTTTETTMTDGTASTEGAAPPPAPSDGVTDPSAGTAPAPAPVAAPSCADYVYWYDAQLAYEGAGGLAADPALVAAFDPDYDGIACEETMALE